MKIRTRAFARIGEGIEQSAGRMLCHGKILLAGEDAIQALLQMGQAFDKVLNQDPRNTKKILKLARLFRHFNRQLIESGKAHFKV